jgi:hypothetical protein
MSAPHDLAARRRGDEYLVLPEEIETFRREGWVHLRGVVSEEELRPIEATYMSFLRRELAVPGKDYCDMSGDYHRAIEDYDVLNVMLPTRYHPQWSGNLYERRAASIARQIQGAGLALDYDQLLAKPPGKPAAVFAWHQDSAYWPDTPDPRTATVWMALDDSLRENGCMRFVSGSQREPKLRDHRPLHGDREKSHTLVAAVDEARDRVEYAEIRRGDVTVHDERVAHGSGGNPSSRWRRAYIVAFRSHATIAAERAMGFTHSHNDPLEVLERVGYAAAEKRAR